MNQFSKKIIDWQKKQGRNNLPWQKKSAYEVWISEIMLQQTQVKTVIPYYEKFISTFPEIKTLAESSEDQVMSLWSGLGYYSRARNLKKTAIKITKDYNGRLPSSVEELKKLPRAGIVHRLDKDTSGVMVLARSRKAARALGHAFAGRDIQKVYWALVVRVPDSDQGRIDLSLAKRGGIGRERVGVDEDEGKRSITDFKVVERAGNRLASLALWPRTGRTHQ